ncbi:MAG TPA: GNAT family N-acetyltransferase [Candidatus Angelobacter sp.]|nr:GNAT family N-acetyltransferase [Candidatus Angelobacter sp.]
MSRADTFEQLRSCNEPAFAEFYRIYTESIAEREQKSKDWICEMVRRHDYRFFLLKRDGHVIGFSILYLSHSEEFDLLEYMAIAAAHRNEGLGSELFRRSMSHATRRGQHVPVLLEVDADREACPDQTLRARRQKFYRRLGCLRLAELAYILPVPGEGPPPYMDLMIYPDGDLSLIPKSVLERWLRIIYQNVYGCSSDDPRVNQMLLNVSDPVRLE